MRRRRATGGGAACFWRAALALVLALGLALLGTQTPVVPPAAGGGAAPDLTAYALPDGTLPVLCLDGAGSGPDHAPGQHCPDCLIAKSLVAAAAAHLPSRNLAARPAAPARPAAWRLAAAGPRAPPARGPPSSLPI